jgi:hypothetical protein
MLKNKYLMFGFFLTANLIFATILIAILHQFINMFFLAAIIVSFIDFLLIFFVLAKRSPLSGKSTASDLMFVRFLCSLLGASLVFTFFLTVPINVDRSFSIWMLGRIYNSQSEGASISITTLQEDSSNFFSSTSPELNRRITEQKNLNNIVEVGDRVELTTSGRFIVITGRFLQRLFGLNPKYSNGSD